MTFFNKLYSTLAKTSGKISSGVGKIFGLGKFDKESLAQVEELLIASDIGVASAEHLVSKLAAAKPSGVDLENEIKTLLRNEIKEILLRAKKPQSIFDNTAEYKPYVLMICGVNGNGKTTTVAKLAKKFQDLGKNVAIAACDTFRAAAVEQLNEWANRIGCRFISGSEGSDPASVAYKALQESKNLKLDVLIIDTAGRLQNQTNLMSELEKCKRVLQKLDESTPHEIILTLDATTGQNAINQVELFGKAVGVSSLILTKLDGSSKGGIAIALAQKFGIPICAIGIGETLDDLQEFSPEEFASAIVSPSAKSMHSSF